MLSKTNPGNYKPKNYNLGQCSGLKTLKSPHSLITSPFCKQEWDKHKTKNKKCLKKLTNLKSLSSNNLNLNLKDKKLTMTKLSLVTKKTTNKSKTNSEMLNKIITSFKWNLKNTNLTKKDSLYNSKNLTIN